MSQGKERPIDDTGERAASELAAALNAVRQGSTFDPLDETDEDGEVAAEKTQVLDPKQHEELMSLRAQQSKKLSRLDKHIVVMFTDLVGSTQYYERYGDLKGREKVLTHNALLFPIVQQHGGVIVKTIGDAIMAYFGNAQDSLRAATRMQQALDVYNENITDPDEQIHIRIALNAGVAIAQEGDIYGDVVNVAARIEHQAKADEILMSASVSDPGRKGWPIESAGSATFKGKAEPMALFRLRWREVAHADTAHKVSELPDRFSVKQQLAHGSSGYLYLVEDRQSKRVSVVKRLYDFLADDVETRAAFVQAANAQAQVELDGIVRIFAISEAEERPAFYEAEFIESMSLSRLLSAKGLPKIEDAIGIVQKVAAVVGRAHGKGLLHRNLEPDNILVRPDGRIAVNNFGMAAVTAVQVKRGNNPAGSPAFTAPEALLGSAAVSERSDIYSLGALLYFLLAGRAPIEDATSLEGTMVAAQGAVVPLKRVSPLVPDALAAIVGRAMGVLPRMRQADVAAFSAELQAFLATLPAHTGPTSTTRGDATTFLKQAKPAKTQAAPAPASAAPAREGTNPGHAVHTNATPTSAGQTNAGQASASHTGHTRSGQTNPGLTNAGPLHGHGTGTHALVTPSPTLVALWRRPLFVVGTMGLLFIVGLTLGVALGRLKEARKPPPPEPPRVLAPARPEPEKTPSALRSRVEAAGLVRLGDAFVVLQNGHIASEWYAEPSTPTIDLGRLSLPVAAFAVGRLIDSGKLRALTEPLATFFPEWQQGKKRLVTVRHLLEHSTGMRPPAPEDALKPPNAVRFALAADIGDEPGRKIVPNPKAFNLLSGLVHVATDKPLDRFFADEIATPLGLSEPVWSYDAEHTPLPSSGLVWTAMDLARLGVAFIDGGQASDGKSRLFSEVWVAAASASSIPDPASSLLFRVHAIEDVGSVFFAADPRGSFWLVVPSQHIVAVRLTKAELHDPLAALPALINAIFDVTVDAKMLGLVSGGRPQK